MDLKNNNFTINLLLAGGSTLGLLVVDECIFQFTVEMNGGQQFDENHLTVIVQSVTSNRGAILADADTQHPLLPPPLPPRSGVPGLSGLLTL